MENIPNTHKKGKNKYNEQRFSPKNNMSQEKTEQSIQETHKIKP